MASLGFTYDDGYYVKDMGLFDIYVRKEIHVTQGDDVVTLGDYSYERLEKLLEVLKLWN